MAVEAHVDKEVGAIREEANVLRQHPENAVDVIATFRAGVFRVEDLEDGLVGERLRDLSSQEESYDDHEENCELSLSTCSLLIASIGAHCGWRVGIG